jgi:hypothetical protein
MGVTALARREGLFSRAEDDSLEGEEVRPGCALWVGCGGACAPVVVPWPAHMCLAARLPLTFLRPCRAPVPLCLCPCVCACALVSLPLCLCPCVSALVSLPLCLCGQVYLVGVIDTLERYSWKKKCAALLASKILCTAPESPVCAAFARVTCDITPHGTPPPSPVPSPLLVCQG